MRVLVAVDGSPFSQAVIEHLGKLLPAQGQEVLVVTVFPAVTYYQGFDRALLDVERVMTQVKEEAVEVARFACERLTAQGFSATPTVVAGDAAAMILSTAETEAVDLIVVGSHGRSGLQRFLMGSVSERVMRHAPCSTLVVRPPGLDHSV